MLVDSPDPYLKVSWYAISAVIIVFVGFFGIAVRYIIKTHRKQVTTGIEGLVGQIGRVTQDLDPQGMVLVAGELWKAHADETLLKDSRVKVVQTENMALKVEKYTE